MNARAKIGIGIVAGVVVIGIGIAAAVLLVSRLDRAIIGEVERSGREALGTDVSLGSVNLSLRETRAELHGLTVANLDGFDAPYALTADTISLDMNLESLTGDVVELDRVLVNGSDLYAEERGGTTNLGMLLERVRAADEPAQEAEPSERIMIRRFVMTNARVHLDSEQLDRDAVLELPEVVVENVGTGTGGVTYDEAAEALLGPVLAAARTAVRNQAGRALSDAASREIEEAAREELERLLDE